MNESECIRNRLAEFYGSTKEGQLEVLAGMIEGIKHQRKPGANSQFTYVFECPAASEGCDVSVSIRAIGKLSLRESTTGLPTCRRS